MLLRTLSILLALTVISCGESTPAAVCLSGAEVACRCDDGALGAATCSADGSGFEACSCNGQPGSGGASSSSSASSGSGGCSNDLSNTGTNDFHFTVDLSTTQTALVSVANQRSVCEQSPFWEIRLNSGNVMVDTDDGTTLVELIGTIPVVDGNQHALAVSRVAEVLTIEVDGMTAGTVSCPTPFAALPPIPMGTDVCSTVDGTQPFSGTLGTVCVKSP